MAMESPLISVALCTWNGARWLRPQLDSILAQQGVALEVVALDDASSDETLAILREYAARDSRIRVYANSENLGHLRSFDRCMAMCEGEFIAPADQDDIWYPRKLRILLEAIGDNGLAYCDSRYVDAEGRPIGRNVSDDLSMRSGREALPVLLQNTVSGHAALLRRETLLAAQPFPHDVYHDWWLALVATARRGIVFVNQPLVDFRRHQDACSAVGRKPNTTAATSRGEREALWFRQRATLADHFGERFQGPAAALARDWGKLLHRLSEGDCSGLARLCLRDGGNPASALRLWVRFRRKSSRIARSPIR